MSCASVSRPDCLPRHMRPGGGGGGESTSRRVAELLELCFAEQQGMAAATWQRAQVGREDAALVAGLVQAQQTRGGGR